MTDAFERFVATLGLSVFVSVSFLGLPFTPQESLRVRSWPENMLKLEIELFRRLESKKVVDLTEGLGLGTE